MLMSGFNVTVFQQPIGDRHTAYSIFTHLNITLLSLHHDEGEILARKYITFAIHSSPSSQPHRTSQKRRVSCNFCIPKNATFATVFVKIVE